MKHKPILSFTFVTCVSMIPVAKLREFYRSAVFCKISGFLWLLQWQETAAWKELSNGLGSVAQLFEEP